MAKRYKSKFLGLPDETEIEVIGIKGDQVFKKIMKYGEAKQMKKAKGWKYYFYQKGFSQFNNTINK